MKLYLCPIVLLSLLVAGCYPMGLSKEEWNSLPLAKQIELREKQARINARLAEKQALADAERYRLEAARAKREQHVAAASVTSVAQSTHVNASPNIIINNTNQQSQSKVEPSNGHHEKKHQQQDTDAHFHQFIEQGNKARQKGHYALAVALYHRAVLVAPNEPARERAKILEKSSRELQRKKG